MPTWDANLYLKFAQERTQPSYDLVSRIQITNPRHIIDLGCGPGNSTAVLRERWPEAEISGLDHSPEMIESASQKFPNQKWILSDIASWITEQPIEIVFSNAALQWVPDHEQLFPHLMKQVRGVLAVQMPAHYNSPAQQITEQVSMDPRWNHLMDGSRNALIKKTPAFYYDLLQPLTSRLEIWETEYIHIMDDHHAIVDWFRGTGLRPFLEALPHKNLQEEFEKKILQGYLQAYPPQKDNRVLFPFRRLFLLAYR